MQTSSETESTSSRTNTPTEQEALALFALINRARLLNGWKAKDAESLDPQMLIWFETFRRYGIPLEAYKEMFDMAFEVRMREMSNGVLVHDAVVIDAALLVSCYTRPHGVKAQMEQRRIESGRFLPDTAASVCERCTGTGMEMVFNQDGEKLGVRKGCDHRPIVPGEGLAKYLEKLKKYSKPRPVAQI